MNRDQRRAARRARPTTSQRVSPGIQGLLAEALRHHRAGQLPEAEQLYREVLAADPHHPDALHLLGLIAHQAGRNDTAVELIGKAIGINGTTASYHSNLGNALRELGRLDDAVVAYHAAIRIRPDHAEAYYNMGIALTNAGRFEEAIEAYRTAVLIRPGFAEAHSNLGDALKGAGRLDDAVAAYRAAMNVRPDLAKPLSNLGGALRDLGRLDEAVAAFEAAVRITPNDAEAYSNLGVALKGVGRLDDAVAAYHAAIAIRPDFAVAHSNLGSALRELGSLDAAVAACSTAISIRPDYAEAYNNQGVALTELGLLNEAAAAFEAAIRIRPDYAEAYANLGGALKDQGRLDAAIAACSAAIRIRPNFTTAHSDLLMALHYVPGTTGRVIMRAAQYFAAQIKEASAPSFSCSADPDRRLRIGYVSADLRRHPVSYFLTSVLTHHDKSAVEVFCYSNSTRVDDVTERLRGEADHWRSLVGLSDEAAASLVTSDGIDLLIDLSGHTGGNRLPMFARGPAPVQVSWLGYFGTTGLATMDYVLADRFVAPESSAPDFVEIIWRLPNSYFCFSPPDLDCPIFPPPVDRSASITFGNFNNNTKTSSSAITQWSRILQRVPGSRLLLKTASLDDAGARGRIFDQFAANGITGERLSLEGGSPRSELLAAYNRVDVALDPMPYGGGTTTAEALWMGVPVVTLRGETWVGRLGESILSAIGLPELVAETPEEYVEIAVRLAADVSRLRALRSELRPRVEASAFCDGTRFTRDLEHAFRGMWQKWCAGRSDGNRQ